MPDAAADEDLARLEVEVPATRMSGRRGTSDIPGSVFCPGQGRADVRLVRRLVLREADVAIDPEWRFGRIGSKRNATSPEALLERHHQGLEWLLQQPLVLRLARLEPRSLVVRLA